MIELRPYQEECVKRAINAYIQKSDFEYFVLPTGCHRKGQGILMYDGTIKSVEDIQIGDLLMGPDSSPRKVLSLHRGQDEMVEICPIKGSPWVVNKGHILSLVRTNQGNKYPSEQGGQIDDVSVIEWEGWSKWQKHIHKLYRVDVDFPAQSEPLPLHPYILGALLGDGGLAIEQRVHFTNPDKEVVEEMERLLNESGFHLHAIKSGDRCQSYHVSGRNGHGRPKDGVQTVKRVLTQLGLLPIRSEHRFVPHIYKTASRQERLELLAGLLDTDGSLSHSGFDFISKSQQLADDIIFLSRSVGLAAYKTARVMSTNFIEEGTYYRASVSGNCAIIPTRVPRKQAPIRQQKKDVLRTGFTCQSTGTVEEYYGFTLDGDHRYLLDDFTVTHNSGKTVIFSQIIHELHKRHELNALVIAHRDELLDQAADKYRMIKPDAIIGKVGSGLHNYGGEVTVASVQTISRPDHLKKLQSIGYGIIIIDEFHHSAANGYQKVLEALPDAFVLGVTATPDRLDKKDITRGKKPLYQASIVDMVKEGYLCNFRAVAVQTDINLDNVSKSMGDFNEQELDAAVNTPKRNKLIVDKYLEYTPEKRAACFCVTVNHAEIMAETFEKSGVKSAVIKGSTPIEERARIYKAFEHGEIKVLCSVMVLTEGWDSPKCEVIIMARPTQSRSLYVQMFGRGLRLAPGKKECVLLDITDNCTKHRLIPQRLKTAIEKDNLRNGETLLDLLEREQTENEEREAQIRKLKEKRLKDMPVDLFEKLEWKEQDNGIYVMEVGKKKHRIALIPSPNSENYVVAARLAPDFKAQRWSNELPLDWAQQEAEKRARKILADKNESTSLVDRNAPWRSKPASEAQIKMLKWYNIPLQGGMTAGQASDLIEAHKQEIERKKKAKEERKRAKEAAI